MSSLSSFFEGFSPQPRDLSTRLIVTSWWLFCLVILSSYVGNLVAFLAVERQKIPFTNLHELLQQEEYLFGVLSNSILTLLFEVCYSQILFKVCSKWLTFIYILYIAKITRCNLICLSPLPFIQIPDQTLLSETCILSHLFPSKKVQILSVWP